jgi:hypothetical protein
MTQHEQFAPSRAVLITYYPKARRLSPGDTGAARITPVKVRDTEVAAGRWLFAGVP